MKVNVHVYDLKSDLTDLFFLKKNQVSFFSIKAALKWRNTLFQNTSKLVQSQNEI